MIDSQFVSLLGANRDHRLVADCLGRISHAEEVRYRGHGPVPLNQIIDTYSVRSRINSELNGGAVEGFDDLLPALKAAPGPSVKLHALEFISHHYVVFTDASTSHMLGILKSPKEKAAWFDRERGYV